MTGLDEWLAQVGQQALCDAHTLHATYAWARMLLERNVPGDFVECGVFAGVNSAIMARAIIDTGRYPRYVHLFDSFEGIPLAGPEDSEFLEAKHPAGLSSCSQKRVRQNMREWGIPEELLVFHPGWFDETVPKSQIQSIALLRLDGDLYRSTKVCMEHLYPLVSPGGGVIVDDFNLSGCRQAIAETNLAPAPIYWVKN